MAYIIYNSINLHCQEGSSDKVYNVTIEHTQNHMNAFVVNFEYGRRGSTLNRGSKTPKPIGLQEAVKIFDKLVAEKLAKGYVDISPGITPGTIKSVPKKGTGILPQLLTPIDEDEVEQYLEDDDWIMQEKLDGERRLIKAISGLVTGVNRKGLEVSLPEVLEKEIVKLNETVYSMCLDGEQIGDDYYVFDMIGETAATAGYSFKHRYQSLAIVMAGTKYPHIHLVKAAIGYAEKAKLYEKLKAQEKEGIVFKHKDSIYAAGRSTQALKYKFYETASFVVSAINAQRSVQIAVMAGDAQLPVGNVTILPNFPVPEIGAVVEVRYLYAYQGGSIYQPVYLGERSDISPSDCSMSQLKYKPNISLI